MIQRANLQNSDYQVLATFRYELRRFLAFFENLARQEGLEPQQQQVLLAIKGLPGDQTATVRALAARLQLRHHSVVELIDRLAAQELVARTRSQTDRRQVVVTLTADGERRLEPLVEQTLRAIGDTGPDLLRALEDVMSHVDSQALPRSVGRS